VACHIPPLRNRPFVIAPGHCCCAAPMAAAGVTSAPATALAAGHGSVSAGHTLSYMSGFGNEHSSEALPGALPVGQNSPQKVRRCAAFALRAAGDASAQRTRRTRQAPRESNRATRCTKAWLSCTCASWRFVHDVMGVSAWFVSCCSGVAPGRCATMSNAGGEGTRHAVHQGVARCWMRASCASGRCSCWACTCALC
jgi:hypothetical protein